MPYTWDDRGNLVSDGTFTYTYNSAGRMARAQSLTATLAYTYNAVGLRVAQSVDGDETTFAWDWASGLPEMLSEGDNLYLMGHDTLGRWDGAGRAGVGTAPPWKSLLLHPGSLPTGSEDATLIGNFLLTVTAARACGWASGGRERRGVHR